MAHDYIKQHALDPHHPSLLYLHFLSPRFYSKKTTTVNESPKPISPLPSPLLHPSSPQRPPFSPFHALLSASSPMPGFSSALQQSINRNIPLTHLHNNNGKWGEGKVKHFGACVFSHLSHFRLERESERGRCLRSSML